MFGYVYSYLSSARQCRHVRSGLFPIRASDSPTYKLIDGVTHNINQLYWPPLNRQGVPYKNIYIYIIRIE